MYMLLVVARKWETKKLAWLMDDTMTALDRTRFYTCDISQWANL